MMVLLPVTLVVLSVVFLSPVVVMMISIMSVFGMVTSRVVVVIELLLLAVFVLENNIVL